MAIQQELASAGQGIELVEKAVHHFGKLDILVVNHGIWPPEDAPIATMSDAQWRQTMDVNLDSVFGLVKAAVAQMKKQGRRAGEPAGHIVLISSTAGQRGEAFHADYAVTKGALISLTKSLSSELAPDGIYVNCVAPGWVATEMSASGAGRPGEKPEDRLGNSDWPRGDSTRDSRPGTVSVHSAGRLHQRRNIQRQRRSGVGWLRSRAK